MAFYISPPRGFITLKEMLEIGQKRLKFLKRLIACETDDEKLNLIEDLSMVHDSDCLIEGTPKDKLSHFILRMCASQNHQMSTFFMKSEVALFQLRWKLQNKCEKKKSYLSLKRQCRNSLSEYLQPHLRSLLSTLITVSEHLLKEHRPPFIEVPFQHVLDMVRLRVVTLRRGKAVVPSEMLHQLLSSLFEASLVGGTAQFLKSRTLQDLYGDIRLRKLLRYFQSQFTSSNEEPCKTITHEDVDRQMELFPPCMKHMHQTLRKCHRLPHSARISYTLFLKEAGLPLEEAIHFWRAEYSRSSASSCCDHVWCNEDHRYLYSLRHMYGLEGCRKNYRSHTCHSLQMSREFGCPFSNIGSLNALLQDSDDIVDLPEDQRSQVACRRYFSNCLRERTGIESSVTKRIDRPVDFYKRFISQLNENTIF